MRWSKKQLTGSLCWSCYKEMPWLELNSLKRRSALRVWLRSCERACEPLQAYGVLLHCLSVVRNQTWALSWGRQDCTYSWKRFGGEYTEMWEMTTYKDIYFFLTLLLTVPCACLYLHVFKNALNSILRTVTTLLRLVQCLFISETFTTKDWWYGHEQHGWFILNTDLSTSIWQYLF